MKTAISIPDPLFDEAERLSMRLGISRSKLYSRAVEAFIREQKGKSVKEALNTVYSSERASVDPVLDRMQRRILRKSW